MNKKIIKLLLYKFKITITYIRDRALTEVEDKYKIITFSKCGHQVAIETI
tara:strand:- start:694 stop:843 length:150 start_codon:yes stop_codon:yes gene_type:complete